MKQSIKKVRQSYILSLNSLLYTLQEEVSSRGGPQIRNGRVVESASQCSLASANIMAPLSDKLIRRKAWWYSGSGGRAELIVMASQPAVPLFLHLKSVFARERENDTQKREEIALAWEIRFQDR